MSRDLIQELKKAVAEQDIKMVEGLAHQVLDNEVDIFDAISKGLCGGMQEVGEMWKRMEVFFPEVMASVEAYYTGLNILKPHMKAEDKMRNAGTMVIGTIWGDLHTVGKDICIPVFEGEGFDVIDLGTDVEADKYIEAVKKYKPDVLGLGTYMSETFTHTDKLVKKLREEGIVGDLPIIICGGPAVDREIAIKMGADDAFRDAWEAVEVVKRRLMEIKEGGK